MALARALRLSEALIDSRKGFRARPDKLQNLAAEASNAGADYYAIETQLADLESRFQRCDPGHCVRRQLE